MSIPPLDDICALAAQAGAAILEVARTPIASRTKADATPVTMADDAADKLILAGLRLLAPDIEVVSEESVSAERIGAACPERFWLVDPLDGTKEFIQRNGEFAVNIALIEGGVPVCGVVLAPALERMFVGDTTGDEAFAAEIPALANAELDLTKAKIISARRAPADGLIAVASRSHRDYKTEEFLAQYKILDLVAAGSSLKFCLVATGEADIYPRLGRTMEWDVAAGHAVLAASGGSVTQIDGTPFRYGKAAQGFANPHFIARGRPAA